MDKDKAVKILNACSIGPNADFHVLSSSQVQELLDWSRACRYQKPAKANGSTARYFYDYILRACAKGGR